ncbi:MAG: helix-turn-helix domain-containing protein [Bacteroides sp.]|nr:helix-turn-helix domain-containing protein [Bacteroides sp.]
MGILIISCFGIALSSFAILLLLKKERLKIADRILCVWLAGSLMLFVLDIVKIEFGIKGMVWPISIILTQLFQSLLYLYSKYIILDEIRFNRMDYFHLVPAAAGILLLIVIGCIGADSSVYISEKTYLWGIVKSFLGDVLIASVWIYDTLVIVKILKYKRKMGDFYSFKSSKISLNWLLFLTIFCFVFYNYTIVMARLQVKGISVFFLDQLGNPVSLLIVGVLSWFGLKQQQLIQEPVSQPSSVDMEKAPDDKVRYTKSGLKKEQAQAYAKQLTAYMEVEKVWKDPELSIVKLSAQTGIPRPYITETLNEYMKKNFSTFINEYRVEYAKQLISSKEHINWSFLAIAYESGFNSKTAFNVFFKKYTQMTPSEYAASVRQNIQ